MKLRPPATPLITCDPYFSVWSPSDKLTDSATMHWTGSANDIRGTVFVDSKAYRFIGNDEAVPAAEQISFDMDAFSSVYVFRAGGVEFKVTFTSPIIPTDLYLISRPVSYMNIEKLSEDGAHKLSFCVAVSEQICLDKAHQYPVVSETFTANGLDTVKMGSSVQNIISRDGDDVRIDWGYFYLSAAQASVSTKELDGMTYACLEKDITDGSALVTFAYDDRKSIVYFGEKLNAYWKKSGETIKKAIDRAHREYPAIMKKCNRFSERMIREAKYAGGEKYADLLVLSLRQCIAAHKLVLDTEGNLLFISKECFSNGCAATVDVSYPSIPLFLIYNPQLVHAMMRPVYKFARSEVWNFDFAPHDAGRYPILNGQAYHGTDIRFQMPVEECGNMIVMETTAAIALGDVSFAKSNMDLLEVWVKYLIKYGEDPEHQLCTDDFAGHLAHNCNLTLKAIMGIAGFGILKKMCGDEKTYEEYIAIARRLAESFAKRAFNSETGAYSGYRLAYNWQNSFSMKYNIVWDKLLGTKLMPESVIRREMASYKTHTNRYGLPLDNRADYTKSDWYIWVATMTRTRNEFESFITPLWDAYNETASRIPMTDWYFTTTALVKGFRNRTVVGGHFMKLLEYKKILSLDC